MYSVCMYMYVHVCVCLYTVHVITYIHGWIYSCILHFKASKLLHILTVYTHNTIHHSVFRRQHNIYNYTCTVHVVQMPEYYPTQYQVQVIYIRSINIIILLIWYDWILSKE